VSLFIYRKWLHPINFNNSNDYWINRYKNGGNSGPGSYNKLATFKSEVINNFVTENQIITITEFGCGDGNQLKLANYPKYIGYDISPDAIKLCKNYFSNDKSKDFYLLSELKNNKCELAISLDVIFHLTEDSVFENYMSMLFNSSEKFVIIYSSNEDGPQQNHFKNRKFTTWIENNESKWELVNKIKNQFPFIGDDKTGSVSDFYFYKKMD
jgi:hypothetical protein